LRNSPGPIAVLFARKTSIYKTYPGLDVYDADRDALNFTGSAPVIAHPPCRAWGRLRAFAKPRIGEKELALFAVDRVIENGGVLEHPTASSLFDYAGLPRPGERNEKGFTIQVNQHWFGHRAEKSTWLFINGLDESQVPPAPLVFSEPTHVVAATHVSKRKGKKELSKAGREATPPSFAEFLIEIAELVNDCHR